MPYIAGGNSWEAGLWPRLKKHPEEAFSGIESYRSRILEAYGSGASLARAAMDFETGSRVIEPDRHLARL